MHILEKNLQNTFIRKWYEIAELFRKIKRQYIRQYKTVNYKNDDMNVICFSRTKLVELQTQNKILNERRIM